VDGAAGVEPYAAVGELVDDVASVGYRAGQSIEFVDYQGLGFAARGQRFPSPGSFTVGAGEFVST